MEIEKGVWGVLNLWHLKHNMINEFCFQNIPCGKLVLNQISAYAWHIENMKSI